MLSIRQESWEEKSHSRASVIGIAYYHLWLSARRDTHDAVTWCINSENDHIVLVPRTVRNIILHVAYGVHRTRGDIDFLQLSSGIERDVAAVWRPKRHVLDAASANFGTGYWF